MTNGTSRIHRTLDFVMNADQIKRKRHLRRSQSSLSDVVRSSENIQRRTPNRSNSLELDFCRSRVIQTRPGLAREVSGLGMEDPVVRQLQRHRLSGIQRGGDMDEYHGEDNESFSIASDPTANEENEGVDMALFHASLSLGGSCGWLSGNDGVSTSYSGHLDDLDNVSRCKVDIFSARGTSINQDFTIFRRNKPHLLSPPKFVDLRVSLDSIDLDEAIEACKRLDAEEIKEFNQHQQQPVQIQNQISLELGCFHEVRSKANSKTVAATSKSRLRCLGGSDNLCSLDSVGKGGLKISADEADVNISKRCEASIKEERSSPSRMGSTSSPRKGRRAVRKLHVVHAKFADTL